MPRVERPVVQPRPDATRAAASTSRTAATTRTSPKRDLHLEDGALAFAVTARPAARATQLQRAQRFLEVLRVPAESKLTFGGRVTGDGEVSRAQSLRNYYPALKASDAFASDPELVGGVTAFLESVSLPDDLRELLKPPVLAAKEASAATGALGTRSEGGSHGDWSAQVHRVLMNGYPVDASRLKVDDASVTMLNASFYGSNFDATWFRTAPDVNKAGLLDVFTRARELNPAISKLSAAQLNNVTWPDTPEMAASLRRACAASGIDVSTVNIGARRLVDSPAPKAKTQTSPRQTPKPGELPSSPVGTAARTTAETGALIAAKDPKAYAVSDAGLELALARQGRFSDQANACVDDPALYAGLVRAWDRAYATGIDNSAPHVRAHLNALGKTAVLADPAAMAALAQLIKRAGLDPATETLPGGRTCSQIAPLKDAFDRLDKTALGALAPLPSSAVALPTSDGPVGTGTGGMTTVNQLWTSRSPAMYDHMTDDVLRATYLGASYVPDNFHGTLPSPRAVTFCARVIELGNSPAKVGCAAWLRAGVGSTYGTDAYIPELVRLAKATDVPLTDVRVTTPTGPITLAEHPVVLASSKPTETEAHTVVRETLAAFDPAAPGDKAGALTVLLVDHDKPDARIVLAASVQAAVDGKLAPIAARETAAVKAAVAAITAPKHLGVAAVLAGLVLDKAALAGAGGKALTDALVADGFDGAQADEWLGHARTIAALDPKAKQLALAGMSDEQPDFLLLPARLELAAAKTLTRSSVDAILDRHGPLDPSGVAAAIVDRAALAAAGGDEREAVREALQAAVDAETMTAVDLRAALSGKRYEVVFPDVNADIQAAVAAVVKARGDTSSIASLEETLKANTAFVDADALVEGALGDLYAADLAHVLPLADADEELGTVAAKRWGGDGESTGRALEGKRVDVAGISLRVNEDADKDTRAVPRKDAAEMVMTPTTSKNLKLIAAKWREGKPVLLEGPTSAGKTSAVRYMAHVTGSPYRRINLSYHTDVSDLLGRYVGGEKKFAKADLEALGKEDLTKLVVEYGLEDEELTRDEAIAKLFEAQNNPRWVDGPVVKAMRRGEVLLLDEVNLARPEVLERLNSLFDDDGNIVLTEHRNEIVKKHDNFRFFATMNPANYAGRERLSKAMRSRWTCLFTQGLDKTDIKQILVAKYGSAIPETELAKLIATHDALARAADDGSIGRASGGLAFSLRNVFRVCERFERYQGGDLDDAALMRRETEEIYRGGLFDEDDIKSVDDILKTAMPYTGPGFYDDLEVEDSADTFSIGDVTIRKLNTGSSMVPSESSKLILTDRTKQVLYRLAKALDCGENVAMIGERASGKTAIAKMFAHIVGQPYYRQQISASTDTMALIGGYDDRGWKDGLLLTAGRPDGVPGMLLLDELNFGSSALLERLNPVLDDERKVVLAEKEGEEIRLHNDFHFVGAMNPPTKGYGSRNKLSKALQNRLTSIYTPDLSDPVEQKQILGAIAQRLGVPIEVSIALVDLQTWATKGYEEGRLGKDLRELDRPELSIRQLMTALESVAEFQGEVGVGDAFLLAVEATYACVENADDGAAILAHAAEVAK